MVLSYNILQMIIQSTIKRMIIHLTAYSIKDVQFRKEQHLRYISLIKRNLLHQNLCFFGFLGQNVHLYDEAITTRIKMATKASQIQALIKTNGDRFNIVHLTTILDRIQQQDFLQKEKLITFVISKIALIPHYFSKIYPQQVRTICNIICYLGNVKNKQLNFLFQGIDYQYMIKHTKNVELVMLLTGLIRLQLFSQIFSTQLDISKKAQIKRISFESCITTQLSIKHILSIWYAYLNEISKENIVLNNFFISILNGHKDEAITNIVQYTYAVLCFVLAYDTLQNKKSNKLFKIIKVEIPRTIYEGEKCKPYQFSLLLENIKVVRSLIDEYNQTNVGGKKIKDQERKYHSSLQFNRKFEQILEHNFQSICKLPNATSRNIANCLKSYHESFSPNQKILQWALIQFTKIVKQQIQIYEDYGLKKSKEKGNAIQKRPISRIDWLSVCSLFWLISKYYNIWEHMLDPIKGEQIKAYISETILFVKHLNKYDQFKRLSNKQMLLLYSGFYLLSKTNSMQYDQQLKELSIKEVIRPERNMTLKQVTLFYSYFKQINFCSSEFCKWTKAEVIHRKDDISFGKNYMAQTIYYKTQCLMNLRKNCFNCYNDMKQLQNTLTS